MSITKATQQARLRDDLAAVALSGAYADLTGKPTALSQFTNDAGFIGSAGLAAYQLLLESGTNIKTVNGQSILGSGNIQIDAGVSSFNTRTGAITLSSGDVTGALGFTPYDATNPSGYITSSALSPYLTSDTAASTYQAALVSGTNIKTVNNQSILGSGNIQIDGGVTSFNTRTGAVTLSSSDVTGALGYTPLSSSGNFQDYGSYVTVGANLLSTAGAQFMGQVYSNGVAVLDVNNYSTYAQPLLVSGTNIKTINGQSVLGSGNLEIGNNATSSRQVYTATAGQTAFSIAYTVGFVDVYLNGSKLQAGVEFTATNGTSIVLTSGASSGDIIDIVAFNVFDVANTYTQAQVNTLLASKQDTLVSGTSIKTVAGNSIVGSGDIAASSITTWANVNAALEYPVVNNAGGSIRIGTGAFASTTGASVRYTTAIGRNALGSITAGDSNVAVGDLALQATTQSMFSTAIGPGAGRLITTGSQNTIIGAFSGNQGGLDIRTLSNYVVLSDGAGTPRLYFDNTGRAYFPSAAGIGYSAGAGGAVTQATSRTTGVTINTPTGAITMFSAAGSTTAASFTVTNSLVEATDTIVLSQSSGTNLYDLMVTAVAAGSFRITFRTTGGTSTDAPVINFAIIKGAAT